MYHTLFLSHFGLNILHHIISCLHITFCEEYSLKGDGKEALKGGIWMVLASEMDLKKTNTHLKQMLAFTMSVLQTSMFLFLFES